jgi:hypothetical protein
MSRPRASGLVLFGRYSILYLIILHGKLHVPCVAIGLMQLSSCYIEYLATYDMATVRLSYM